MVNKAPVYHLAVYCLNNNWQVTDRFIASLIQSLRQVKQIRLDLHILNNGILPKNHPKTISTLRLFQESVSRNLGYAKGHNYLLAHLPIKKKHQLVIFANNDLFFPTFFFRNLIVNFEKLPAVFSPVLVEPYRGKKRLNVGLRYHWTGGTSTVKGSLPEQVFLSGACLCFSPNVIRRLVGNFGYFFDEGFGSYFEDIELQFRLLKLGIRPQVVSFLKVHHYLSHTLGIYTAAKYQLIWKNHLRLILLHWPLKTILFRLPTVIIASLYYPLLVIKHNHNPLSIASMFSFVVYWLVKETPDIFRKRSQIKHSIQ